MTWRRVLALTLLLSTSAAAQSASEVGMPSLRTYTTEDFGLTATFGSAVQDRRGVLFFSGNLLTEYDGATWRRFRLPDARGHTALAIDPAGRIWVGGVESFGYLEPDAHGTFQAISLRNKIPAEHQDFAGVGLVVPTPQGVYFGTAKRLFRWDGKQMKVWKSTSSFNGLALIHGKMLVSQREGGLQELVNDEFRALPGGAAFAGPGLLTMLPYDDRRILIGTSGGPLSLYDGTRSEPFATEADEYLKTSELNNFSSLPDGGFCLATRKGGVILIDHQGRLRRIINQDSGLPPSVILSSFTDREGNLWIGHRSLTRIALNSPISVISRTPAADVTRNRGSIYTLNRNNLFRLQVDRGTGLPQLQPIGVIPGFGSFASRPLPDNELLIASNEGVFRLEGDRLVPALPEQRGQRFSARFLVPSKRDGRLVYVGYNDGLGAIRWDGAKWVDAGRLPHYDDTVVSLSETPDGTVWWSDSSSVLRAKIPATGLRDATFERFGPKEGLESGSQDVAVAGSLLFTSGNSQDIRRWDEASRTFVKDKRFFLAIPGSVYDGIFEMPSGDIFSSNASADDQRFALFRPQAGGQYTIIENPLRQLTRLRLNRSHQDPDGVIWFAGLDGLVRFDPGMQQTGTKQGFSTLVRRVRSGSGGILFGGIGTGEGSLPYDSDGLRFDFAAPTFTDENGTRYQYRLDGAGGDWSSWDKQTEANYSNLAPHDYRFRVRARNTEGQIGAEAVYSFTVRPPWYRTTLAYLAYALLFGLAIYFARHRLISREREKARLETETLEAQSKVLEATVAERTREISNRAAELATVNRITQAISTQLDKDKLVELVGEQIRDLFHAPIAYVALLDRATMMLHFPYSFGEEAAQSRPFGEGLTSQIIRTGQPLLINEDLRGNSERMGIQNMGRQAASYLGVPISSGGESIGVVSVQTTDQEGRFTEADQRLLSTIAASVGVAFHNAQLFDETQRARATAEQADAAKSSFLSTVSHELRTPLTSVLGFAKIIRRRLEDRLFPLIPEDDRKIRQTKVQVLDNLGVVVSEGERLTKLIDDVLDLAKIEAGKFTWNMEQVEVGDIIERALSATSSLFDARKLHLVRDLAPNLPPVNGDRDRLIQVVINLISNAVKFTDSGSITCTAHLRDGAVVVSVTDSGIGISPADQPKVFEKFKQVGDTLTDKPKGTGLGLPICREIVEHHGGRIWVESAPGQGSTFSFTLPAKGVALTPRPIDIESLVRQLRETVASQSPRAKSILVVDDDPHIRSLLQQEFIEAGYAVRLAEDGRKALAMVREEPPGLIVLDVMMPEMNGFDVAAVLKNDPVTMDIPIIILSIVEDKERGFRLGVDRYLTKPIDTASLFREVGTLLDQGQSHKKVMVVDEDASTLRTVSDVLETRGYQVVESNGAELFAKAISSKPDIIMLSSLLTSNQEVVRSLRFEKGLENVLFLVYR